MDSAGLKEHLDEHSSGKNVAIRFFTQMHRIQSSDRQPGQGRLNVTTRSFLAKYFSEYLRENCLLSRVRNFEGFLKKFYYLKKFHFFQDFILQSKS
jgi:hypothetical protein